MSNLTQEELFKEEVGQTVAKVMYMNTTCSIAFAGVQCFMCTYIVLSYLESSKTDRRGRLPYIIASILIFVLFTLMTSVDAFYVFNLAFSSQNGQDFLAFAANDYHLLWARKTSIGAMIGYVAIADSVLVYRSFMVWRDKRWVCIPNVMALVVATALAIAAVSVPSEHSTDGLTSSWTACSAAVNIMTTATIAFRLIRANRRLQRAMPDRTDKFLSDVVTLIVESALPPAVFGIIFAGVTYSKRNTVESAKRHFASWFTFALLFYGFVALSPQLIIYRVTTGRSRVHADLSPAEGPRRAEAVSNPLRFAHSTQIESIFLTPDELRDANATGIGSSSDQPIPVGREKDTAHLQPA